MTFPCPVGRATTFTTDTSMSWSFALPRDFKVLWLYEREPRRLPGAVSSLDFTPPEARWRRIPYLWTIAFMCWSTDFLSVFDYSFLQLPNACDVLDLSGPRYGIHVVRCNHDGRPPSSMSLCTPPDHLYRSGHDLPATSSRPHSNGRYCPTACHFAGIGIWFMYKLTCGPRVPAVLTGRTPLLLTERRSKSPMYGDRSTSSTKPAIFLYSYCHVNLDFSYPRIFCKGRIHSSSSSSHQEPANIYEETIGCGSQWHTSLHTRHRKLARVDFSTMNS